MNLVPGLVSVTFRKRSPAEIVRLARDAGLRGIEWGGDVHVPHGDLARAREVAALTRDAGLSVISYGSYYRAGHIAPDAVAFERVLETAIALGAPAVRIWAGKKGSAEADEAYRAGVAADGLRAAGLAAAAGVKVAVEYHGWTLIDTLDSTLALLAAVPHPAFHTYWQTATAPTPERGAAEIARLSDRLLHLHVNHSAPGPGRPGLRPLREGAAAWRTWLAAAAADGRPRAALLEFVRDNDPAALADDAAALREMLAGGGAGSPAPAPTSGPGGAGSARSADCA